MWPIVDHMATLAKGREIGCAVVGNIVVQVRAGKLDKCPTITESFGKIRRCRQVGPNAAAFAVAPSVALSVEPTPIGKHTDKLAVGPSALLA